MSGGLLFHDFEHYDCKIIEIPVEGNRSIRRRMYNELSMYISIS